MKEYATVNACDLTTMHCGGTIATLYEPETKEELASLLGRLDSFVVIGGGSNMIFSDGLIATPVIRLGKDFSSLSIEGGALHAQAATPLKTLLQYCIDNGLSGLEFMAGIPGTVGGALAMNAGTPDKGIMDAVLEVEYVDGTGIHVVKRDAISYGYRRGGFDSRAVVISARLRVEPLTPEEVAAAMQPYLLKKKNQPKGFSSGSMFRNPPGLAAGRLIEQAGLKGLRIGGAKISEIHANFIINDGNATTADIRSLLHTIKERVKERFGIELQEEVKIIDERL
ncbi:MAG: UDP-N-acetylmuramate dehydrogenase [Desulfomonilia bacterium]|jgi:UDP-N-acetylmuramate dehydrogenase|uniref:UDP-N-acetylmuramate dehydrogenase n=1 Tax=anaerobic digester metagenome TaxID=1263854 RepID=A0A485M555_9ZZZZ|nr:UDP-N-acetylmuramate dehydrogenase [Pseudomonadota bacterium]HON38095.1 UDP-N-acetylmuramate dehydrogenase [Deltaproteobacteria bacterium]HRS56259.1 UDP-N-acetylmuramate dehydrogenase [Desulfomonilia bacterium]HPD21705.1 UDP-N-acetylmuramate dehydrogenase [Deltaproteobacteria bacterium]HPX18982.1 UDP-N-acetylmuramate dehydrogenase [Deltaproteobacteria bacterium]